MTTVYLFPDTNTFLHFKRPDQIDLCKATGAKEVILVVVPIVLAELENQKVFNQSKKYRGRATSVMAWLAKHIEEEAPTEIRPGVKLLFIRHTPSIDFAVHRLQTRMNDDNLIASALEFRADQNAADVKIYTADMPLRAKLVAHKLKPFIPSELDRLPDELDETQKELEKSKAEVARLTNRLPDLRLTFKSGKLIENLRFPEPGPPSLSLAEIKEKYPILPIPPAYEENPRSGRKTFDIADLEKLAIPPGYASRQQNESRQKYHDAYASYLEKHQKWSADFRRCFVFDFQLHNDGTAEATKIDVDIQFPPFIELFATDKYPAIPRVPRPPAEYAMSLGFRDPIPQIVPHFLSQRDPTIPRVRASSKEMSYNIPDLKHSRVWNLQGCIARFADNDSIQNFEALIVISTVETAPTEGSLQFLITTSDENEEVELKGPDEKEED